MKLILGRTMLAPVAWGSTYLVISELLPPGRPLFVAATRVLPAGLALVLIGLLSHRRGQPLRRFGRPIHVVVLATFNFALFFPLLVVTAYRLPGGVAATFGGTQPLLVLLVGRIVAGEPVRARQVAIGTVAAVGVALVVLRPGAGIDPIGVIAAFTANVSFALGVVLTRRFPPPPSRIAATGAQLLVAAALLLPLAIVVEGGPPRIDASAALGVGYLSLLATGAAFVAWFDGIRLLPATTPPLLGLANPLTAVTLGWVLLGQSLSSLQMVGVAVTVAAIAHGSSAADPAPAARLQPPTTERSADTADRDGHRSVGHGPTMRPCVARTSASAQPTLLPILKVDATSPPVVPGATEASSAV